MPLSEQDIIKKLQEFVETDAGKKCLRSSKVYNGVIASETRNMSNALISQLIRASMSVTKDGESLFPDKNLIQISTPQRVTNGNYIVRINFPPNAFYRESLISKKTGKPLGSGAHDIVGLFTKGYRAQHYVSGMWSKKGKVVASHSLSPKVPGLSAHSFIDGTIANFIKTYEAKHKGTKITVSYPSLWHS